MKYITIIIIFTFALGCSKQEKNANQNADSVKSSGSTTAGDVKQTNQTTSQPMKMKEYKKGEPIELYDLIYMLLPDEGETGNYVYWTRGVDIQSIQWEKRRYDEFQDVFIMNGELRLTINGEGFDFPGDSKNKFKWYVSLTGKEPGYDQFDISSDISVFEYNELSTEYLLANHDYNSSTIKKSDPDVYYEKFMIHEIKFPGKKLFWLKSEISSGSHGSLLILECYLNKNDFKKDL